MIKKIWEMIKSEDLEYGSDICIKACDDPKESCGAESDSINIHCWDGRRYNLSLTRLPNGCKYDPSTGKPVVEDDAILAAIDAFNNALNGLPSEELDIPLNQDEVTDFMDLIDCCRRD